MPNQEPIVVPTDVELRERAGNALKETLLFGNVSRRLLADLVDLYDLLPIGPVGADVIHNVQPAVLVVLEGTVRVQTPPTTIVLQRGTYLASDPVLGALDWHGGSAIASAGAEAVRVFLLSRTAFHRLPRVIVNALNIAELDKMNAYVP
jgi:hypothetical protein